MPKKLAKPAARKPPSGTSSAPPKRREGRIPLGVNDAEIEVEGGTAKLTNLNKIFWPKLGLTKRDLLQYYLDVSPYLMPHLKDRAMVMKRYPNGIDGGFFFMKRAPSGRPSSVPVCAIEHGSGNVIDFPVVQHVASLMWARGLGCIRASPWYARGHDVYRPDFLQFDLDQFEGTRCLCVLESPPVVRDAFPSLKITR